MFKVPEKYRCKHGNRNINEFYWSDESFGNNGAFIIPIKVDKNKKRNFTVIASDGDDWEHVSVSLPDRDPTWLEMCQIKGMFWDDEDCIVQYHPPRSDYVNLHKHCLHLWRPISQELAKPPSILVGW